MTRSPGSKFLAPIDSRIHPAYYYGGKPEVRFNDKSSPFSSLYWRKHFSQVDHERHQRFDMGRDEDEDIDMDAHRRQRETREAASVAAYDQQVSEASRRHGLNLAQRGAQREEEAREARMRDYLHETLYRQPRSEAEIDFDLYRV